MYLETKHFSSETEVIQWFREAMEQRELKYTATQLLETLDLNKVDELEEAIHRAFIACRKLDINTREHFQQIYCAQETYLCIDWRLSTFAYLLILVNCNPLHPLVAKTQIELIEHKMNP